MLKIIAIVYVIYELYRMLFKKGIVKYLLFNSGKGISYVDYVETEKDSEKIAMSFNLIGTNNIMINVVKLISFAYCMIYILFYVGIGQMFQQMLPISIIQSFITAYAMIGMFAFINVGGNLPKPISTKTMHDISKKIVKQRFLFVYFATCIEIIFIYQLIIHVII